MMEDSEDSRTLPPGGLIMERRIRELFEQLDTDKDGTIDADELRAGLERLGHGSIPGAVQQFMDRVDKDGDKQVSFREFLQYITDHEQKLWCTFSKLDRNQDGKIDIDELLNAIHNLGITISRREAKELIQKMDIDGDLNITWNEWREFLLFHPSENVKDIVKYWRHSLGIDIGDNVVVPDEFSEIEKVTGMWWRQLVAGGGAGAVSRTCTAPLDRLKILLQVEGSRQNLSFVSGFRQMLREGGVRSLWRGNGINVLKIAPESAIKFFAYEHIKRRMRQDNDKPLGTLQRLAAGSAAGVIAQTSIYPMEVLKTRLALATTGQYRGIVDAAYKIATQEGGRALFRGLAPSLLGIIPYAGIDLTVYETLKIRWLAQHPGESNPGPIVLLVCGATSSTVGQLASYPLSLVRTRLQAISKQQSSGQPNTMIGVMRGILADEGPRGLYRGLAPNFMKVLPAVSISYVVYEKLRELLGVQTV